MVAYLDNDDLWFPDPHFGDADGLIAVGGDLSVERLKLAYSWGIFPWYPYKSDLIEWYCPLERFVIFPEKIHISHSMRTLFNKCRYSVSINTAFEEVIRNCGHVNGRYNMEGAWLGEDIVKAYLELHKQGISHSVEVWDGDKLVGGLYGEKFGNCFIGESMFSLIPSGSKIALITLAHHSEGLGIKMIDCQLHTPHLESMGGEYISYEHYLEILQGESYSELKSEQEQ